MRVKLGRYLVQRELVRPQDVEGLLGTNYNVLGIGGTAERKLSLRYTDFIAPIVHALQEQQRLVEAQAAELSKQTAEIALLKQDRQAQIARIDALEARAAQIAALEQQLAQMVQLRVGAAQLAAPEERFAASDRSPGRGRDGQD